MGQLLLVNPKKRRKAKRRTTAKKRRTYRRNPLPAIRAKSNPSRRRYRRKPTGAKDIINQVMDASMMAGGAVVTDLISSYLPIPADLKTGNMAPLVRAGIAISLGLVVEKGLRQRDLGRKMAQGSLVVIAHDTITKLIGPQIGLTTSDSMGAYSDLMMPTRLGNYSDSLLGNDQLLGNSRFDDLVTMSAYENPGYTGVGSYNYDDSL